MEEKHTMTAKDKFILTVVLLVIFIGVFGLGIIGVVYSLLS